MLAIKGPKRGTVLLSLVAMLWLVLAPSTSASSPVPPAIPYNAAARFLANRFVGGGTATSVIHILAASGSISTQFVDRRPGQTWVLDLYDAGTCATVRHVVATLPSIRIGVDGRGSARVNLSAATRQSILAALTYRKTLVLRLSTTGYRTCQRYFPIP
jgi:hypothetical protein